MTLPRAHVLCSCPADSLADEHVEPDEQPVVRLQLLPLLAIVYATGPSIDAPPSRSDQRRAPMTCCLGRRDAPRHVSTVYRPTV